MELISPERFLILFRASAQARLRGEKEKQRGAGITGKVGWRHGNGLLEPVIIPAIII